MHIKKKMIYIDINISAGQVEVCIYQGKLTMPKCG